MALDDGAVLVQLSRALFLAFLASRPNALQIYLQQGVARLWRVANFILSEYLSLPMPLTATPPSTAQHGEQPRRTSDTSPTRCSPTVATMGSTAEVAAELGHSDVAQGVDDHSSHYQVHILPPIASCVYMHDRHDHRNSAGPHRLTCTRGATTTGQKRRGSGMHDP